MLRTLLRIMKRNGFFAGFFVFLAVGFVFPSLHSTHAHGAVAIVHQHSDVENAALGMTGESSHVEIALVSHDANHVHGDHHTIPGQCNDDCCAPGCCALPVMASVDSHAVYFEMERLMRPDDRHLSGLMPLTAERPPRA